jgi:apolipoprotein N-acyltransferase
MTSAIMGTTIRLRVSLLILFVPALSFSPLKLAWPAALLLTNLLLQTIREFD